MTDYLIKLISKKYGRIRELEISPTADCRLIEGGMTGFGSAGFDVVLAPYASRVGGYPQKKRFAEREIGLSFEILPERADEIRRLIVAMLDPKAECELDVAFGGVHRKISVIPYDEAEFNRGTFYDSTEVNVLFIAPGVFFRDAEDVVVPFRDAAPMLTFPMNFMVGSGSVSGMYRTTDSAVLKNTGDGECGLVAKIAASGGAVVHPGIVCGEDFVKCPITLDDGDVLIIDTREARKNITKNGERSFMFDKNSRFFSLIPGENSVSITCDSGEEFVDAEITFTPLYYGM